jgi:hypothetical protein
LCTFNYDYECCEQFLLPDREMDALVLVVVVSIWQGILLLKAKSREMQAPKKAQAFLIKAESGTVEHW